MTSLIILLDTDEPPNGFVVATNPATGLLTNQRRIQQRRSFHQLARPVVVAPPPLFVAPYVPVTLVANQRVTRVRRGPYSDLRPPAVVVPFVPFTAAPIAVETFGAFASRDRYRRVRGAHSLGVGPIRGLPAGDVTTVRTTLALGNRLARTRRGPFHPLLRQPVVLPAVTAPPLNVTFAAFAGRRRRAPFHSFLNPPTVFTVFAARLNVAIARISRRRFPSTTIVAPVVYPATSEIGVSLQSVPNRTGRQRRAPRSFLAPPQFYPQTGVPNVTIDALTDRVGRVRRRPRYFLRPPTTLQTFGPPVETLAGRTIADDRRRRQPRSFFTDFVTYPQATSVTVTVVQTRPRWTHWFLTRVVYPQITPLSENEVFVSTVIDDRRRRAARSRLAPPVFYPATSNIAVADVRIRPRHTIWALGPLIFYPAATPLAVTLAEGTRQSLRSRETHSFLSPPIIPTAATFNAPVAPTIRTRPRKTTRFSVAPVVRPQTSVISIHLVHVRPRPTAKKLYPPTTLQTFAGPTVTIARVRPQHTTYVYINPVVLPATSKIAAALQRTRPRHVRSFLAAPSTLAVFPGPVEVEVAVRTPVDDRRRRGVRSFQVAPVVYPQTSQIDVRVVRNRPRRTVHALTAVVYPATSQVAVHLVRVRPRPTRHYLTSVGYSQTSLITAAVVHTRPRPTASALYPPTTLQTFGPPVEEQVVVKTAVDDRQRRRVRSTTVHPVVSPQTSAITLALVRARPRKTYSFLTDVTYPTTSSLAVTLVHSRPRPTATLIAAPAALLTFNGPAETLQRIRPRPIRSKLTPPTAVRVPAVEQAEQTIRVTLVHTRPKPTVRRLSPPTVVDTNPPGVTTLRIVRVAVRTRVEHQRHIVGSFLRPPTVVAPLPTLRQQTITVVLTHTRPRQTRSRLAPPVFYPATSSISTQFVATRPPLVRSLLSPPVALRTFGPPVEAEVAVQTAVADRHYRGVRSRLAPPVFYAQIGTVKTTLAQTRPRTVRALLRAPATLPVFAAGQLTLARTRARPVHSRLPLVIVAERAVRHETEVAETLTRARPRPTIATLFPPTAVTIPARVEHPILVALARYRPLRRTLAQLQPVPPPPPQPSWTTGESVPAAGGSAESIAATVGEVSDVGSADGSAESAAGAGGTITSIGAAVAEIHDERGGLPE